MFPDYGSPGSPNLDPYYVSPERERAIALIRSRRWAAIIEDAQRDIAGILQDMEKALKDEDRELVSVSVDIGNLGVEIVTR